VFRRRHRFSSTSWVSSETPGNATMIKIEVFHSWEIDLTIGDSVAPARTADATRQRWKLRERTSRPRRPIFDGRGGSHGHRSAVQSVPCSSLRTSAGGQVVADWWTHNTGERLIYGRARIVTSQMRNAGCCGGSDGEHCKTEMDRWQTDRRRGANLTTSWINELKRVNKGICIYQRRPARKNATHCQSHHIHQWSANIPTNFKLLAVVHTFTRHTWF